MGHGWRVTVAVVSAVVGLEGLGIGFYGAATLRVPLVLIGVAVVYLDAWFVNSCERRNRSIRQLQQRERALRGEVERRRGAP